MRESAATTVGGKNKSDTRELHSVEKERGRHVVSNGQRLGEGDDILVIRTLRDLLNRD